MVDEMLPPSWRRVKLVDVQAIDRRAIVSGPFGSNIGSRFFVPRGVPVIRGNNLAMDLTRFIDSGFVFVTDGKAQELQGCQALPGDLVFTAAGSLGQVGLIPRDARYPVYIISNKQMRVRLNSNIIDELYAFYWFSSPKMVEYLQQRNTGSSVPLINLSILRELPLLLPPLPEQRAIARILGALDDKIELNRRMNETLEAMARALFQSWFVDFDPVRAKAEGRQPAGMDAETAALFPDALVDSELGDVPSGWHVSPLSHVLDVNPKRSLRKGVMAPYLEMGDMPTSSARAITYEERATGSGMKFINGDVLMARITPCLENGKTAYVDFLSSGQVGWGSTEYIVFRSKPPIPEAYAYFLARSDTFRSFAIQNMTGTSGRQRVPVSCFDTYQVIEPSAEIAQAFGAIAHNSLQTMKAHDEESRTLAVIRDTLLPKLLSGAVRVRDAEQVVEEVLA